MKKSIFYLAILFLCGSIYVTNANPFLTLVSASNNALNAGVNLSGEQVLPLPVVSPLLNGQTKLQKDSLTEASGSPELNKQVVQWIQTLSHENGFEAWKEALWESYPLGPGMHGWVVILRNHEAEIGYLLVNATKDGQFILSEYGSGKKPLYSMQTLYQALIRQEIIAPHTSFQEFNENPFLTKERMYLGTLQSFWKVTLMHDSFYFDAKSGDRLPQLEELLKQAQTTQPTFDFAVERSEISGRLQLEEFDPLEKPTWIDEPPLAVTSFPQLKDALIPNNSITYAAKLYNRKAIYSLALTGYHCWNSEACYLRLDQEGPRYVPFLSLLKLGHFYCAN